MTVTARNNLPNEAQLYLQQLEGQLKKATTDIANLRNEVDLLNRTAPQLSQAIGNFRVKVVPVNIQSNGVGISNVIEGFAPMDEGFDFIVLSLQASVTEVVNATAGARVTSIEGVWQDGLRPITSVAKSTYTITASTTVIQPTLGLSGVMRMTDYLGPEPTRFVAQSNTDSVATVSERDFRLTGSVLYIKEN